MENINYEYIDNVYQEIIKKHTVNIKILGRESIKIDISLGSNISVLKFILSQLFPNFENIHLYNLINLKKINLDNHMSIQDIKHENTIYMSCLKKT